jgi:hypothetical protein
MIANLGFGWFVMALAVVGILSFLLSLGLDAILNREGFGAGGNAFIITVSFFLSLYALNWYGIRFRDVAEAAMMGVGGAFVTFLVLVLGKALANRV